MVEPLNDHDAALAILKDAEAADEGIHKHLQEAYSHWQETNQEMKQALAKPPAPG